MTDGRTLINVGFGYDEEGGYFVEERDGKAVAMFAERFDADAYVTMCSDLAAATARAEAAEAERDELRSALSDEIGHKDVIYVGFTVTKARLEAAEAALAAVPDYATYYWQAYTDAFIYAAPRPMTFADWLAAGKPKVHP